MSKARTRCRAVRFLPVSPFLGHTVLVIALMLAHASLAPAQNGYQFGDWKPSLNHGRPLNPAVECSALTSLTGFDFSIESATLVAGPGDSLGYCQVTGQILPEVRLELSLPGAWNGRFYMFGNGGYAGEDLSAANRAASRDKALMAGFAVAQTNTGHDAAKEPLGSFAVNRQKLLDYAFRAVHVTAVASKRVIGEYYGSGPKRSYFDGCSTGGRQGLISAQRFPEDFDGIVVGAPVLDFTGTMTNYVAIVRALAEAPIPVEKVRIIAERVYAGCDGTDGLVDGLIEDPRRCNFDPARDLPVCAGGGDAADCFTGPQIRTLNIIYRGAESGGKPVFWGQPVGAEAAIPARTGPIPMWVPWIVSPSGRTISEGFAETFFRYLAFPMPDPKYDLKSFDLETDLAQLQTISRILDAKDPDLGRFKSRGGKIVMYFGWADAALNPMMGIDYYERVRARFGSATSDFLRLFMVPGMAHCRGGVGTDQCDFVTTLVDWVENGAAPERIVAAQSRDGKVVRTRPLCPYPQVWKSDGDPNDAKSFSCVDPGRRN